MATEEELRHYAESLPPIYREILGAFPRLEPSRKQGYGLAFQTLAVDFERPSKRDSTLARSWRLVKS